jgi:hypothetical protein
MAASDMTMLQRVQHNTGRESGVSVTTRSRDKLRRNDFCSCYETLLLLSRSQEWSVGQSSNQEEQFGTVFVHEHGYKRRTVARSRADNHIYRMAHIVHAIGGRGREGKKTDDA